MDQELHHELRPRGVEHYRREAKALLRAVRRGDPAGAARARDALGDRVGDRFVLADALHVVAVEHGHRSWPAFKHDAEAAGGRPVRPVYRVGAFGQATYAAWADRLLAAAQRSEPDATQRLRAGVPRLRDDDDAAIATRATQADARVCSAREYGFRTWAELAEATDRARRTHYSRLPPELPWKQAEAAIRAGDAERLRSLLDRHPGLEREDPGMTLLAAAAQPEAGSMPREVVDLLVEAGSALDDPLSIAPCFDKPDLVAGSGRAALTRPLFPPSRRSRAPPSRLPPAADVLVRRAASSPTPSHLAAAAATSTCRQDWLRVEDGQLRPEVRLSTSRMFVLAWPCPPGLPGGPARRGPGPRGPPGPQRPPAAVFAGITGPTPRVPRSTG